MTANTVSPRIRMLIAAVFVGLASGSNYGYSGYAPQLSGELGLSSTQANIVGLGGNLGVYLTGPIWGKIIDVHGPRMPLISAAILTFIGYQSVRLFYLGVFPIRSEPDDPASPFRVALLALALFATGTAGSSGLGSAMNTVARSFPDKTRASATGAVLAGFGLSAFVFSTLGHLLFHGEAGGLLLVLSWGTMLPHLVGSFMVRPYPPHEDESDEEDDDHDEMAISRQVSLGIEPGLDITPSRSRERELDLEMADEASPADPLLSVPRSARSVGTPRTPRKRRSSTASLPPTEIHMGPYDLFRSGDFYILFVILALLCGVGLEWINNVGAVTLALARDGWEYDQHAVAALQASQVATISVFNCAGRIIGGAVSDLVKSRIGIKRIWFLPVVAIMFIASELAVLRTTDVQHLWLVSASLGLAYGALFNVLPMLVLEWFGMANFGQNWGYTSMAPVVGGNIFLTLFGKVYDSNTVGRIGNPAPDAASVTSRTVVGVLRRFSRIVDKSVPLPRGAADAVVTAATAGGSAADLHECLKGKDCYATAFRISALACVIALVLSIIAGIRRERMGAERRRRRYLERSMSSDERTGMSGD